MKLVIFSILTFIAFSFFGARAFAAPNAVDPEPAGDPTCVFESGEVGKLKFRGTTREEAFEKTARACLQARVSGFIKIRGDVPTPDRKILFAEDCVNKTYCKH